MVEEYRIEPICVDDSEYASGVLVNEAGEWLGDVQTLEFENAQGLYDTEERVIPFPDEDGDYIPAPQGWRSRIVARLTPAG